MVEAGSVSGKWEVEIYKIGGPLSDVSDSAAEFLDEPVLTLRAVGTTVVPKQHQRFAR
jgi:3-aminobutyryl-CoA ammonia-lyase